MPKSVQQVETSDNRHPTIVPPAPGAEAEVRASEVVQAGQYASEYPEQRGDASADLKGSLEGSEAESAALPALKRMSLQVDVTQQFVGEVPGGYRVDLYYSGERLPIVVSDASGFSPELKGYLERGRILSGSDWVTINSETVLDFDSRITLALQTADGLGCPVAGRLRGRAHLRNVRKPGGERCFAADEAPERVLAVWRLGFEQGSYLPLVLAASFDVPRVGLEAGQTTVYEQSRELANALFVSCGKAIFRQAPYGSVEKIEIDLYTINANSGQLGAREGAAA